MAGPTVTLTFAGDSDKLQKSFDDVGKSAKGMSTEVGSSSASFDRVGGGIDTTGNKAGDLESGFRGVTDSMSGFSQIAQGDVMGGLTDLAGGAEALAMGFSGVVVPALQRSVAWLAQTRVGTLAVAAAQRVAGAAAVVWAGAQRILNAVMRANPILLVVTAITGLIAIFVLAWKRSETFRNIVTGVWNAIKNGAQFLWERLKSIWGSITGFLSRTASRIGGFFSGMWDGMVSGLKAALNGVIWLINGAIDGINFIIRGVNHLPFVDIPQIGKIPTLHSGGIVPGAPGSETLALLQAGERVTPAGQTSKTVMLQSDGSAFSDLIMSTLRNAVRREGGDVQLVLGAG